MAIASINDIEARLSEAEKAGLWLVPADEAEAAALRRRAKKGELATPFPGSYARTVALGNMRPRQRAYVTLRTLSLLHPDWVFCSFSAAVLHGLWVSNAQLGQVHILRPKSYGRTGALVRRHRVQVDGTDIVLRGATRMTSLQRTVMDCLCAVEFCHALPLVDSALHWELADVAAITRYLEDNGAGRRGIQGARAALAYADGRSGSGGESFARAKIIELGFQVPELQVELEDPMEPENPKFADFGWLLDSERPVIGEFDGLEKYKRGSEADGGAAKQDEAVRAMSRERRREAHINLTDAKVIRFSMEDVVNTGYFERLLRQAGVPRAGERVGP